MKLGTVKIYTTSSNSTITLSYSNPLVLYNIKILAINSKMNLTITVTNPNGDSWSFTVSSATEISFKKINYQSITFNDKNQYTIYYTLQAIYTNSYQELLELEQESDISIIPVNNVIITSPIDSAGNLMVDVENYPLDSNGNLKVDIESEAVTPINVNAFSNTLTTANTKQALAPPSGYPTTAQAFLILINLSPSDIIYVGDTNNQVIPLGANQSMGLDVHKLQILLNIGSIYWYGATSGTDKVGVFYA